MTAAFEPSTVVVVGSSVGGVRTAQALRSEGFTGRVVLVGEESQLPYDKPPLSKQFLAGVWDADRVTLLDALTAQQAGIELRLGSAAERLDVAGKQLHLADGTWLDYDAVVIATGAAARPSPWATRSGVHVLRTLADSSSLQQDLRCTGPLVVVGGGFIGAEVAATARALGREVTVVDPLPAPIGRIVGRELGDRPLLVLATYRADELTRRHPLYQLLPALEREARAARLDLRPLGGEDRDEPALRAVAGKQVVVITPPVGNPCRRIQEYGCFGSAGRSREISNRFVPALPPASTRVSRSQVAAIAKPMSRRCARL